MNKEILWLCEKYGIELVFLSAGNTGTNLPFGHWPVFPTESTETIFKQLTEMVDLSGEMLLLRKEFKAAHRSDL